MHKSNSNLNGVTMNKKVLLEIEQILKECDKQLYLVSSENNVQAKIGILNIKQRVLECKVEIQNIIEEETNSVKNDLETSSNISLTKREIEVLKLLSKGLSNKELAYRLFISERTVQFHIKSLFEKLSATSRTEVVTKALTEGIITTKEL